MPLGNSGTFNFMIVFQAEHNIFMHPFHMLGIAGVFSSSLFSVMHGYLVSSSLIWKTTKNEFVNEGYRFGQDEETYNIVATHGYFGRLIFQYASFNNSRSFYFFLELYMWCYRQHINTYHDIQVCTSLYIMCMLLDFGCFSLFIWINRSPIWISTLFSIIPILWYIFKTSLRLIFTYRREFLDAILRENIADFCIKFQP
ncbi:Photosystem II protein D1 [Capsicum annuum]|uniref:Photosystem II protein D1 n=1 Tax=Capsicum annuum TaxID=4072 RepID=A0A2G2YRL7_CAPAN|nr:Photosystem II protein D1 [Capsicum annuum]